VTVVTIKCRYFWLKLCFSVIFSNASWWQLMHQRFYSTVQIYFVHDTFIHILKSNRVDANKPKYKNRYRYVNMILN